MGNLDSHAQFVHEDDVVEAISRLLLGKHAGQFNLAADGLMTRRECAELLDTRGDQDAGVAVPRAGEARLALRQSEAPGGGIDFELYPWILSNEKVKKTLDWTPRYDSRETFLIAMRAQGRLPTTRPWCRRELERGGAETPAPALRPLDTRPLSRAVSSAGRAPARQAGGHWFEPSTAHQDVAGERRGRAASNRRVQ